MNCKPGDLAIMVRSIAGNEGKIFRCLRIATKFELDFYNFEDDDVTWVIDAQLPTRLISGVLDGAIRLAPLAKDACLRPIGDPGEDATDETLLWLPVPSAEKAEA